MCFGSIPAKERFASARSPISSPSETRPNHQRIDLPPLNYRDVELVVIGGRCATRFRRLYLLVFRDSSQLACVLLKSKANIRWIRAPLNRLFTETRKHLPGEIKLGGRRVRHGLPA